MKLAGIDIGSNAMRLLIGEIIEQGDHVHVSKLSLVRLPIRLGSDVFRDGHVHPEKVDNFVKGMHVFKSITEIHKVEGLIATATSAMRNSSNGKMMVDRVKAETDIDIEIIDGDREADIILSTYDLLELDPSIPYLYIDVGGGSTEISVILNGKPKVSRSFKIGTVRLIQGSVEYDYWEEMMNWGKELGEKYNPILAIGSGGNINKISKILMKGVNDPIPIHDLESLRDKMKNMSLEERMIAWDLRSDRADVIVPASSIYIGLMKASGLDKILVPKVGLADGLIYFLFKQLKLKRNI